MPRLEVSRKSVGRDRVRQEIRVRIIERTTLYSIVVARLLDDYFLPLVVSDHVAGDTSVIKLQHSCNNGYASS
jgi:hypothetical protein